MGSQHAFRVKREEMFVFGTAWSRHDSLENGLVGSLVPRRPVSLGRWRRSDRRIVPRGRSQSVGMDD